MGANRTLVLVNGKRLYANPNSYPTAYRGLDDLCLYFNVPSSAQLERIEILKWRCISYLWPSDAVGVCRGISSCKRRFEGSAH